VKPGVPVVIAMVIVAGCRPGGAGASADSSTSASTATTTTATTTTTTTTTATTPAATSVVGGDWIEKITLSDGGLAYVTPATGATGKRPVVVAIHGAVDDPGLMCGAWRLIADVYPFVVCPAGTPIGPDVPGRKYVWGSTAQIEKRALEALTALEAKYPEHITPGAPVVYAAFSQGATMAAPFLVRHAKRFPRAVLTEGGHHAFEPDGLAQQYAKAGGERVMFTCSQGGCAVAFEASRAALERADVRARVVYSGPHGHSMPPPVRTSVHAALPFVVENLAGWEGYADAPKLPSH
jgi:pimeloyl-ACP methyl ester carboxylesterase